MAKNKTIPARSEVLKENTWATEDLFVSDEAWLEAYNKAQAEFAPAITAYKGKLSESGEALLSFFKKSEELSRELYRIGNYAMRKSDEDLSNGKYLDMQGKAMSLYVKASAADAFSTPEILAISDKRLKEMYAECPELEIFRRHLDKLRARKAHTLSEKEEALLAGAEELGDAASNIGSALRNADMTFPTVKDKDGNKHQLTQGSFISLLQSDDVVLRRRAFKAYYKEFAGVKNTAAALLNEQAKQLIYFARSRKYNSALEASLGRTEVPVEVYNNLIATVNDNLPVMHKYMRLRKKILGGTQHMYDIYRTLVSDAEREIPYEEAVKTVLEGLSVMGDEYISYLKEGFENRWVDVYENKGKRGGAYSAGALPHPYVLMNYSDTLDSMFTLAHEMGHALHSYYSMHKQRDTYAHYVIFVAEVASTCNEVLLMKHLLSKTADKAERAYLINYFLDQFRTTLYRQTMFAEYEKDIIETAEQGNSLTADLLCEKYLALNKKYYGSAIVSDDEIALEWARIPHFFYNFYVFQYATGFSAAVALADKILKEGKPAVDKYISAFLSAGCSKDPISILRDAGIDMATPAPIDSALKLFSDLVDEMDSLMNS